MSSVDQGFLAFIGSIFGGRRASEGRTLSDRLVQLVRIAWWAIKLAWANHPGLLFSLTFIIFLDALLPAGMALTMRGLINGVVEATQRQSDTITLLIPWLLLGLGITVLIAISQLLITFLTGRLADELDINITSSILSHAGRLDVAFFEDARNQDIIQRARQDSANHFTSFLLTALRLTAGFIQIASMAAILLAVEPLVIIVLIPLAIPHLLFQWYTSMLYYRTDYKRATKVRWSGYFASLLTRRDSVAEVKLLGLAPLLITRLRSILAEFRDQNRKRYLLRLSGSSVSAVLTTVVVYGLFVRVIYKVLNQGLTVGDVAIFAAAALRLRSAMEAWVRSSANIFQQTLYISNLRRFLEIKPSSRNGASRTTPALRGKIEFDKVSFTYPDSTKPVLSDVSFKIEPGETVALVGKNGAGKTTLVKLLAQFYDADAGRILIDGIEAHEWSTSYLHENMTFVFQNFIKYEATARENIAYGNWKNLIDDSETTQRLAEEAGIGGLIRKMPNGYDTFIGRQFGKYDLSGGQWQQMAIARALARDARLVILDEPTSNLDAEAEYELFSRFCKLASGRTTILISHRFSTVSMADHIMVLDGGRLIEWGTHKELVSNSGHYATLYELQRKQMGLPVQATSSQRKSSEKRVV